MIFRNTFVAVAVLGAATLSTAGELVARRGRVLNPLTCNRLSVSGVDGEGRRTSGILSARSVEDATFTLRLAGSLQGEHVVELRVYLPGGHLYQSLAVPVDFPTGGTRRSPSPRHVAGYPFPVRVQAPALRADRSRPGREWQVADVTATMPLAGTSVTTGGLYGDWSVEAFLDGASTSCRASSFQITP